MTARSGVAAGVLVAAWCLLFREYGFELADEGTLLAQFARVARGEVPYRDFHTGYAPGVFWLNGFLLRAGGGEMGTVRTGLAVVHGLAAAIVWRLAHQAAGGLAACTTVALVLAFFLPVAPGAFCTFNVPYPAWYAGCAGLAAVVAVVGAHPFVAGVLWGMAFVCKQNVGLFGLGGTAVAVALTVPPDVAGPLLGIVLGAAVVAGGLAVVGTGLAPVAVLTLLVPVVVLAAGVAVARPGRAAIRPLTMLAVGFLVVAGPVLAWVGAVAGSHAVVADVLQLGTDTARVYRAVHPTPGSMLAEALRSPGVLRAGRIVADGGWLFVLPAVHLAGVAALARRRPVSPVVRVLACVQTTAYLQLHPRMDVWHVLTVGGPTLALGFGLLARRPAALRTVAALGLGLALVRIAPGAARVPALLTPAPESVPRLARADVRWDLLEPEHLRLVPDVVSALGTPDALVGFPALGLFNFLTGVPSPLAHDYFFPGRPTDADVPAVLAKLPAGPGARALVLDAPIAFFPEAFAAHAPILSAIEARYPVVQQIGPYRLLAPAGGR